MHHSPRIRVSLVSLALAAGLAAGLPAQRPPAWLDLTVTGGVNPANITNLGKMTSYLGGGFVHVSSACTRTWSSWPVGAGATSVMTNDCLLVRDATTWIAFSALRGRFALLPVSAGAQFLNPAGQNNDSVLLVLDNGTLHAFSGFVGRWTSRPVSATATFAVQRHTGLLADGTLLSGYDGFSGQWHDTTVPSQATGLSTDGTAGVAISNNVVHGFSALRGTWSSAPLFVNPTLLRSDDWVVFRDGSQALGFSGLRGSFASTALAPVQSTQIQDLFGTLVTAADVQLFSAATGAWSSIPLSATATVRTTNAAALVFDTLLAQAWSATLGSTASVSLDAAATDLSGTVVAAMARTTNAPFVYSAMTGAWHAVPGDVLPGLPMVTQTTAVLPTATGFRAFSARTGAFVPLAAPGGVAVTNSATAPALAYDNATLHFFDARTDRWIDEPRTSANPPTVALWRTTALVLDGNDAVGWGTEPAVVERITLPEPAVSWRANSESLGVTTANHLLSFAAVPLTMTLAQFPDFRRAFVAGATARLQVRLLPGDVAFLGGGVRAPAPIAVPGLGELLLDPASANAILVLPEADADRAVFAIPVPDLPALHGSAFWFQSLVLPASGSPYLTDATVLHIV